MNQNLSSYWIFYTVANAGNISKAAKELYISQPAISKSIQKLEESVNCKLFARSSRGVVLTDEGQLLFNHVSEAFETPRGAKRIPLRKGLIAYKHRIRGKRDVRPDTPDCRRNDCIYLDSLYSPKQKAIFQYFILKTYYNIT